MAASSALAVLSLAAQASFDVERTSGLDGPVSLYLVTIANSGERKTTNDKKFLKPIHEFMEQNEEQRKENEKIHRANEAAWKSKNDALLTQLTQLNHYALKCIVWD